MALPPIFRRKDKASSTVPASAQSGASVEAARVRARRRLIGAVVLLGIGIVAFPLLFETAPRPIPVDLPIEIPRKDAVAPLAMPASVPAPARQANPAAQPAPRAEGQVEPAARAPEPPPEPAPEAKAESPPKTEAVTQPKPTPKQEPSKADDAARAKALLEGQQAAPAPGRWVVQIGAFAEDQTVRNVRAKAGKIGLQTFTQVVAVEAGERTRVRVGPFAERDEADAAAAKLKKAGLPASVLKL